MTTTYKVLGQSNPVANTATSLYIVPPATSAVCSTLSVCNQGVSTTYRVAVRPAGASISPQHYLIYEAALSQYDSTLLTLGITLAATDVITVQAGTSSVAFQLFGSEIS